MTLNIEGKESPPLTESEVKLQSALIAAIAATGIAFVLRFGFDAPLVPEMMADSLFAVLPVRVVEFGIGLLGSFAKQLAFVGCATAYLLLLAAVTYLLISSERPALQPRLLIASAICWVATVAGVIPVLGGGFFGRSLRQGAAYTCVAALAAHGFHYAGLRLTLGRSSQGVAQRIGRHLSRRAIIKWAGAAIVAIAFYDMIWSVYAAWRQGGAGRVENGDGIFPNINGLMLEVTPTDDFYQVSKNPFDPVIDERQWRLEINGQVETPFGLSYEDLKSLPSVEHYATLECISNEVGGDLMSTALWRGVTLKHLLERAGVKPGVVDLVFRASDGYSDSIPIGRALAGGALLAFEMNGARLKAAHGFPLRLIVPGIFGMKNVKWITAIEAVDFDFKGYWQKRGWDDRAEYKTMSRIDAPSKKASAGATIAGVAFAGDRGVSKVEVSTDGGAHWEPASIRPPLSSSTWVLWHKQWNAPTPGEHRLVVRATDGTGVTQTVYASAPIPSGATGYHSRVVRVESQDYSAD